MRDVTVLLLWLSIAVPVWARDTYVVGFAAQGKSASCRQAWWSASVELFNANFSATSVRLIDISNGQPFVTLPATVDVPPHQVTFLPPNWRPAAVNDAYSVWVLHLDVPDGITVINRDVVQDTDICIPPALASAVVKSPLPVITALVPPNQPQVKLGTDVGSLVARQNVMIYNAAATTANAIIEVRRSCDDAVMDSRTVAVPPNTILQTGALTTGSSEVNCRSRVDRFSRYTVVTVDQPSFSVISTLIEDRPPSDVIPLVGIVAQ